MRQSQASGFSSRGGTRGTEACLGRSASFAVGGKYFRIVCSSNVQISSAISTSDVFSIADADASIRSSRHAPLVPPFIDESVRAREVTLHRRNALSAGGIPIPPRVGAALGVRAGPNELRPAWTPPATTWSPRLRIFNRGEMQP